jgi:hypothetical protein
LTSDAEGSYLELDPDAGDPMMVLTAIDQLAAEPACADAAALTNERRKRLLRYQTGRRIGTHHRWPDESGVRTHVGAVARGAFAGGPSPKRIGRWAPLVESNVPHYGGFLSGIHVRGGHKPRGLPP